MSWKKLEWGPCGPPPRGAKVIPLTAVDGEGAEARGGGGLGHIHLELEKRPDGRAVMVVFADRGGRETLERLRRAMADRVPDGDLVKVMVELSRWWLDEHRAEVDARLRRRGLTLAEAHAEVRRAGHLRLAR